VNGLEVDLDGAVLRVRISRPDKRNALDDTMVAGLIELFETAGNDEAVRAVSLSAAGEHFCSGADIVARNSGDGRRPRVGAIQRRLPGQAHRLIPLILSVQTPVVCAVRGWAAGIGLAIAMAADFTVASTTARFWAPFCDRGFTPDSGTTWTLISTFGQTLTNPSVMIQRRNNITPNRGQLYVADDADLDHGIWYSSYWGTSGHPIYPRTEPEIITTIDTIG